MMEIVFALIAGALLGAVLWALAKADRAQREAARVQRRLAAYMPEHVVRDALLRADDRPIAMVHDDVTVAVFKIRHFSSLTERLEPAQALRYLNECYLLCGTAVHRNGGTIERLIEDGVVAVFGIGANERTDHHYRGIRAALEATRMIGVMINRWENEGRRPLRLAVGVHSGPIVAGDVGFQERRAFALVGNTVAVAHRLQQIAEEINAAVVTSADAYQPVEPRFSALPVKQIPLKHMHELHDAFIIRGLNEDEPEVELTLPATPALITTVELASETLREPVAAPPIARTVKPMHRVARVVEDAEYREDPLQPIVPDPIWPSTYEDDNGPPIRMRR